MREIDATNESPSSEVTNKTTDQERLLDAHVALEQRYQELRQRYARLLVHQGLIDERLKRIETSRPFRLWNKAVMKGKQIYHQSGRALRRALFVSRSLRRARQDNGDYRRWVSHEQAALGSWETHRALSEGWKYRPLISVVMAASDSQREAIQSVLGQSYSAVELCIAFEGPPEPRLADFLSGRTQPGCRVWTAVVPERTSLAEAINAAASLAQGEFLVFLEPKGQLSPFALHYLTELVQRERADILYSDEDHLDSDGRRVRPIFKPDWSPNLLTSCMYFGHFFAVRRELFHRAAGVHAAFGEAVYYELALRLAELTSDIRHIPRVLYHRHLESGMPTNSQLNGVKERDAIQSALDRRNWHGALIENGSTANTYSVLRPIANDSALTVIICSKSGRRLRRCLESVQSSTKHLKYEVIIVDHNEGERDPEMRRVVEAFGCNVVPYGGPFNFSLMNNLAASRATHSHLLFMNDDVYVRSKNWAERLLGELQRPEIGVVGTELAYPSGAIQHAGVVIGIGDGAGHAGRFQVDAPLWPWLHLTRDVSAVTGAFLGIRNHVFRDIGGFDPSFPTNYNDVDLCLRVRAARYTVECLGQSGTIHEECQTRQGIVNFYERDLFYARWGHLLSHGDPFYSVNLSPTEEVGLNFTTNHRSFEPFDHGR
jgi:GT2 family glycosyltransferase